MTPIRDNILLKPIRIDNITESGLFVPEMAMKPSNKCEVIAVGKGLAKEPMQFKKGDIVYRVKSWGNEVLIDGELHYLMSQKAILAAE